MIDDDLYSLCQLLTIPPTEHAKSFTRWIFDTLHVRGVEQMDTIDVYNYFGQAPKAITWLSNISCNVRFEDMPAAVNCALDLANGLVVPNSQASALKEAPNSGLDIYTADSMLIPVPPNYRYLLGVPNPKAKSIIIRFATVDDIRPSEVNPRTTSTDLMQCKPNVDYDYSLPHRTILNSNNSIIRKVLATTDGKPTEGKRLRLRLHADDENEVKKAPVVAEEEPKVSVHDRLGWKNKPNNTVHRSSQSLLVNRVGKGFNRFKTKKDTRSLNTGDLRHVLNKHKK